MSIPAKAIRDQLSEEANRLQEGRRTPIDVKDLLDGLGIRLTLHVESQPASHGSLIWNGTQVEVVVRQERTRNYLTPRERFTVAHELGHFFIEARFGVRPADQAQYWEIEGLCNEFAGSLLLPERLIRRALTPAPNTSVRVLQRILRLVDSQNVSFQVAGREVSTYIPNASVGELLEQAEPTSIGKVLWVSELSGLVGVGRGAHIAAADPLAEVIRNSMWIREGRVGQSLVNGVVFSSLRLGHSIRFAALLPPTGRPDTALVGRVTAKKKMANEFVNTPD